MVGATAGAAHPLFDVTSDRLVTVRRSRARSTDAQIAGRPVIWLLLWGVEGAELSGTVRVRAGVCDKVATPSEDHPIIEAIIVDVARVPAGLIDTHETARQTIGPETFAVLNAVKSLERIFDDARVEFEFEAAPAAVAAGEREREEDQH